MISFYDTSLRYELSADNDKGEIVLNKEFNRWNCHVYKNLATRNATGGPEYSSGKDKTLLEACIAHRDTYRNSDYCKNVILLTHPLFLHLSSMPQLSTPRLREDAETYKSRVLSLFSMDRQDKFSIVLLENLHDYAAATSLLLQNGKVDDVLFTKYKSGRVLPSESLVPFRHKNVYMGGSYNGQCLKSSILEIKDAQFNCREISYGSMLVIKDLVLDTPLVKHDGKVIQRKKLFPNHIDGVSPCEAASLDEILEYLEVKEPCRRSSRRFSFQLNF